MIELKITSPAFEPEGRMPNRHSGFGEDISPELYIDGIVENAVSMAVTLDDLGHPIQPGYNHWVTWNIPVMSILPEHLPKAAVLKAMEGHVLQKGCLYGKYQRKHK